MLSIENEMNVSLCARTVSVYKKKYGLVDFFKINSQ